VVAKADLLGRDPLRVRVTTASGQVDEYTSTPEGFAAVSRDGKGLRWAKFNGLAEFKSPDLAFTAPRAVYQTVITAIDYKARTLVTRDLLPENPGVRVGNPDRWSWLQLKGKGTAFTWDDDLLIHAGRLTEMQVTGQDTAQVKTNHDLLFAGVGNRQLSGLTVTNEEFTWHFRSGKVIRKPDGATLTDQVFTDANGDGCREVKTYEIGLGDAVVLPVDVTFRRARKGYEVRTNVRVEGNVGVIPFARDAAEQWQAIGAP
jgi:hypothetical protein